MSSTVRSSAVRSSAVPSSAVPSGPAIDRRDALLRLALGGSALVLPGLACVPDAPPAGRPRSRRWFIFYYLMGGWDLTLLTEPALQGPGMDVRYRPDEIWTAGGHRFGPGLRPLERYMDRMAIIRGLKCEALNHPQARFQLVTGKFRPPHTPVAASVQSHIAAHYGAGYPLPNISSDAMRPAVFLGDLAHHVKPMRVASVQQLKALTAIEGRPAAYADRIRQAVAARDERFARTHGSALAREFASYAELSRAIADSDFGRRVARAEGPQFEQTKLVRYTNNVGRQVHLAEEIIRRDLAPVVTLGTGSFDAHNGRQYNGHRRLVTRALEAVKTMCDRLDALPAPQGGTLLDHTTIVVTSEFSREPWINELGGKHHWAANSVLLIGNGVARARGGGPLVFGECDDRMFPQPIDPATGRRDGRGADDLLIPHALATVMAIAGLDPGALFDVEPITRLIG